jgi:phenylacetate-coenzyme A ligase PaaK-like adenylate-forming protein
MNKSNTLERAQAVLKNVLESSHSNFYRNHYFGKDETKFFWNENINWEQVPFLERKHIEHVPLFKRVYLPANDIAAIRITSGTSGARVVPIPWFERNATDPPHFKMLFGDLDIKRLATFSGAFFSYEKAFRDQKGINTISLDLSDLLVSTQLAETHKPDIIGGFTYAISALSEKLSEETRAHVAALFIFGEWCSKVQWKIFQKQFPHALLLSEYSSIESQTPIGVSCHEIVRSKRRHVHPLYEYVYVEIIDPNSGQVLTKRGETGEIVITVLRPVALPLIRYKTGDSATIISNHCSCKLESPILAINGRLQMDRLRILGGEINIKEVDRVLSLLSQYLTSGNFELRYMELSENNIIKPQLTVRLLWDSKNISKDDLVGRIETNLRVNPKKTYREGVLGGEYLPIRIEKLEGKYEEGKRKCIVKSND